MARVKKLFTIGYEQTPPKAVLDELENAGVKLLVDVRAIASSRRPGFSKNQLAAGLDERGGGEHRALAMRDQGDPAAVVVQPPHPALQFGYCPFGIARVIAGGRSEARRCRRPTGPRSRPA